MAYDDNNLSVYERGIHAHVVVQYPAELLSSKREGNDFRVLEKTCGWICHAVIRG